LFHLRIAVTTDDGGLLAGAEAAVEGMKYMDNLGVISVQEMHAQLGA
jgi:hypothetical protein